MHRSQWVPEKNLNNKHSLLLIVIQTVQRKDNYMSHMRHVIVFAVFFDLRRNLHQFVLDVIWMSPFGKIRRCSGESEYEI